MKLPPLLLLLIALSLTACTTPQQQAAAKALILYGQRKGHLSAIDAEAAHTLTPILFPSAKSTIVVTPPD